MQVGDELRRVPTIDSTVGFGGSLEPQLCRVVAVNAAHAFYVVEFTSEMGRSWRETFYDPALKEN